MTTATLQADRRYDRYAKRFPLTQKLALIGETLAAYMRVRWVLWRKDFSEIVSEHRARNDVLPAQMEDSQKLAGYRLAQVVARVLGVLPSDSRCLTRSLVLMDLLEKRDIRSSLVIGVASEPKFTAHAWVEVDGVAVLPPYEYDRLVEL